MNLLLRMWLVFLGALRRPRLQPLDTSVLALRVWLNDLDVFGHMNNGRYPSIMDLGRLDLITRIGLSKAMVRQRWFPLVAASSLRFRRPLQPFQRYELHTRMVCWDEKWFYLEQRFQRGDQLIAIGWIKGLIRGPRGNIATANVMAEIGYDGASPPMPAKVQRWEAMLATDFPDAGKQPRAY